jgi:hypothetical protein
MNYDYFKGKDLNELKEQTRISPRKINEPHEEGKPA